MLCKQNDINTFEERVGGVSYFKNYSILRRSWETQIIKAYKLVPAKLGCFVK